LGETWNDTWEDELIILKNVPFKRQARFLHDNVCRYPDSAEFAQALDQRAGDHADVDIAAGLKAHRDALRGIYADLACIEGKNDKTKSAASQLSMSYDRHPSLVPAVRYFANSTESIREGTQKSLYRKLGIFLKGDYEAGILQVPIARRFGPSSRGYPGYSGRV
jgi:hypothetical protein